MYHSGGTCLQVDCIFFSELALLNSNWSSWSSTNQTQSSSQRKVTCSRHDMAEKLFTKQNHSLTIIQACFLLLFCNVFVNAIHPLPLNQEQPYIQNLYFQRMETCINIVPKNRIAVLSFSGFKDESRSLWHHTRYIIILNRLLGAGVCLLFLKLWGQHTHLDKNVFTETVLNLIL